MRRRHLLATTAASLVSLSLAGCSALSGGDASPSADHAIAVQNDDDQRHTVGVTVARTDETDDDVVYDAEHELAPGESKVVYNLEEAEPDGIETFSITGRLGDESQTARFQTDSCHGDVQIQVSDGAELDVFYAIC